MAAFMNGRPAWRLSSILALVIVATLTSYALYLRTWHFFYLGAGSALLLCAIFLRSSTQYLDLFEDLKGGLKELARGHLDIRLYSANRGQSANLTQAFNEAAQSLEKRNRELQLSVTEQNAVLSSMAEGVIAINDQDRIIRMNETACRLLRVNSEDSVGRNVQEVIRNADVLKFIERAQMSREPVEGDIILRNEIENVLKAYGRVLRDGQWNNIGVLIVFSDVTRLRHLENVRRDFVANVSHELRTPITSIKGFIETLADGAIDNPQDARRFLDILGRQADRLNAIFEDLLTLSRIEEGGNGNDLRLEPGELTTVIKAAVDSCTKHAEEKKIRIINTFHSRALAKINENLLEQALHNLIDNAVKYSDEGTTITLESSEDESEIHLHIRDQGPGIDKVHLPRIFERFYRVDKARTRKSGGTGLGLAIVKHIAECHQGRATVESVVGQGSTFSLHLPVYRPEGQAAAENIH